MTYRTSEMPCIDVKASGRTSARLREVALGVLPYVVTTLLCALILTNIYGLNKADLRIPLEHRGDAEDYEAVIKDFVETGHIYVNDRLGAPGVQERYDFPLPYTIHFVIMGVLKIFTRAYGLVFNLFYLLGFPLVAMTALYVFRHFGIPPILGVAGSTLFSFLPYHLWRNESHLFLSSYYFVPLGIMVVLWVCLGRSLFGFEAGQTGIRAMLPTRRGWLSLGICVLIASDNPYHAFFTGVLVAAAALLAHFRYGHRRALFTAGILGGLLAIVLLINVLPSLWYYRTHATNPVVHRNPAEAEVFGLKITQLVAPVTFHRIPALAQWKEKYNTSVPLVTENDSATLGVIATAGFLALLVLIFGSPSDPLLQSLSYLNLWAVLVGTIGGFGSLFNFLMVSQFRCYNRLSVFIAFFSLLAVLILSERLIRTKLPPSKQRHAFAVVSVALLIVGLADQIPLKGAGFPEDRPSAEAQYHSDEAFVKVIENSVPAESMIFQLPYIVYPGAGMTYQAWDYEQVWGYRHSRSLRWSFGSIRGRGVDHWVVRISREPVGSMVSAVAAAGFAGIAIDRHGYADSAASLETQLRTLLGEEPLVSQNGQFSFFRLDSAALQALRDRQTSDRDRLPAGFAGVDTGTGCWSREGTEEDNWHWCDTDGEIVVMNNGNATVRVSVDFVVMTGHPKKSDVVITGPGFVRKLKVNSEGTQVRLEFPTGLGDEPIHIHADAPPVDAPRDPRHMIFRINNLVAREIKP